MLLETQSWSLGTYKVICALLAHGTYISCHPECIKAMPEAIFVVMRMVALQQLPVSAVCFSFLAFVCILLHTFSGTEGLKLISNVQKAFQRCQNMTAVAIVKMHPPPLSSMA